MTSDNFTGHPKALTYNPRTSPVVCDNRQSEHIMLCSRSDGGEEAR